MADIASLSLEVKSDSVKESTVALREMVPAASAAERAAQRWGMTTTAAARSTEDFSRRVRKTIGDLEFERQQLTRNSAEQQKYAALRRAGVAGSSAEGRAILASVAALQAQRAASASAAATTKAAGGELALLARYLGPAALGYMALSKAQDIWARGLKAGDLGEQAEQIGVNTDQLQAYRFAGAQAGIETEQMDTALVKLAKTMGAAADGGKEQIELFDRLGVKLLDARGELRSVAEVLPEVARGVLEIASSSQRTSTLMELFGRSGAKMTTVLEDIAQGNDSVIAKARAAGVILDRDVIAAWDRVSDSMVKAQLAADTTYAKLGAPIATAGLEALERLLKSINGVMDQINSKEGFWASVLEESRSKGRIGSGPNALRLETPAEAAARRRAELEKELQNPANAGREAMIQEDLARLRARDVVTGGFYGEDVSGAALKGARAPATNPGGSRNPTAKGSGSDPYAKAIESAREYVLTKKAEIAAVGESVLVAARLKHEQELLNKATGDGTALGAAQVAELKNLAGAMAEADNRLATAKFMDDARTKSADFIAAQEMEQQALFLSAEAADALRFSTEMLNDARRQGIELTPDQVDAIKQSADAMAAAKARTDEMREMVGLGREVFKGFFSDLREGLNNGQTLWEAFGNAALNALNRIAEKLLDMAATKLFEQAFGGSSGGGGGLGGLIGSIFGGGGGGGISDPWGGLSASWGFAKGGAFNHGNVIPFAAGGLVTGPTPFPMSGRRTGLMGEAGPEAIMPLKRGPNGSLGVQMHGGSAANENTTVIVNQTIHVGEFVTTQQFASGMRTVKKSAEEGAQAALISRRKRGGLDDVFR